MLSVGVSVLSFTILSVIVRCVIMIGFVKLLVILLCVIMLSCIMLNVIEPSVKHALCCYAENPYAE
jgi:hypothetical protein